MRRHAGQTENGLPRDPCQGAWERDPESGTDRHNSLNQAFIHYADHRAEALRLITNTAPLPL